MFAVVRDLQRKTLYGLIGLLLVALVFILVITLDSPRSTPRARIFTEQAIEAATLKILPLRESGAIFSWDHAGRKVCVRRSMWDELPAAGKKEICQAMAIARSEERLLVLDETGKGVVGVCNVRGEFTTIAGGVVPEWAGE